MPPPLGSMAATGSAGADGHFGASAADASQFRGSVAATAAGAVGGILNYMGLSTTIGANGAVASYAASADNGPAAGGDAKADAAATGSAAAAAATSAAAAASGGVAPSAAASASSFSASSSAAAAPSAGDPSAADGADPRSVIRAVNRALPQALNRRLHQAERDVMAFGAGGWGQTGVGDEDAPLALGQGQAQAGGAAQTSGASAMTAAGARIGGGGGGGMGGGGMGGGSSGTGGNAGSSGAGNNGTSAGGGSDIALALPRFVPALLGKAIRSIACGAQHTVALSASGEAYAFGQGGSGRLGTGTTACELTPRLLLKPGHKREPYRFRAVACGDMHTVALGMDGAPYTWGCGRDGATGLASRDDHLLPTPVPFLVELLEQPQQGGHAQASDSAGSRVAAFAFQSTGFTHVAAGGSCSVFVDGAGRVFTCGIRDGPLGHAKELLRSRLLLSDGTPFSGCISKGLHPLAPRFALLGSGERLIQRRAAPAAASASSGAAAGATPTAAMDSVLGLSMLRPIAEERLRAAEKALGKYLASCNSFVGPAGAVQSALNMQGAKNAGDMMYASMHDLPVPLQVIFPFSFGGAAAGKDDQQQSVTGEAVVAISCGELHIAAQTNQGNVFTWGSDSVGQLGLGDPVRAGREMPTRVWALPKFCTAVACGAGHTLALVEDRSKAPVGRAVYAWGSAAKGQVPFDLPKPSDLPEDPRLLQLTPDAFAAGRVVSLPKVVDLPITLPVESGVPIPAPSQISAGYFHSVVLTDDGSIFVFGEGAAGELGLTKGMVQEAWKTARRARLRQAAAAGSSGANPNDPAGESKTGPSVEVQQKPESEPASTPAAQPASTSRTSRLGLARFHKSSGVSIRNLEHTIPNSFGYLDDSILDAAKPVGKESQEDRDEGRYMPFQSNDMRPTIAVSNHYFPASLVEDPPLFGDAVARPAQKGRRRGTTHGRSLYGTQNNYLVAYDDESDESDLYSSDSDESDDEGGMRGSLVSPFDANTLVLGQSSFSPTTTGMFAPTSARRFASARGPPSRSSSATPASRYSSLQTLQLPAPNQPPASTPGGEAAGQGIATPPSRGRNLSKQMDTGSRRNLSVDATRTAFATAAARAPPVVVVIPGTGSQAATASAASSLSGPHNSANSPAAAGPFSAKSRRPTAAGPLSATETPAASSPNAAGASNPTSAFGGTGDHHLTRELDVRRAPSPTRVPEYASRMAPATPMIKPSNTLVSTPATAVMGMSTAAMPKFGRKDNKGKNDGTLAGASPQLNSQSPMLPSGSQSIASPSVKAALKRTWTRMLDDEETNRRSMGIENGDNNLAHSYAIIAAANANLAANNANANVDDGPLPSTRVLGPLPVVGMVRKDVLSVACGLGYTLCVVQSEWQKDELVNSCNGCNATFTLTRRKHHCRSCGGIYCASCTSRQVPLLKLGHIQPVRVCDTCYNRLQNE
jgi:alpha-tubulin suppressor-like RCC1 family protein